MEKSIAPSCSTKWNVYMASWKASFDRFMNPLRHRSQSGNAYMSKFFSVDVDPKVAGPDGAKMSVSCWCSLPKTESCLKYTFTTSLYQDNTPDSGCYMVNFEGVTLLATQSTTVSTKTHGGRTFNIKHVFDSCSAGAKMVKVTHLTESRDEGVKGVDVSLPLIETESS
ncbi:hypothetical protein nvc1_151 [Namao virus]|nr:hypothetical protein nvc1_151 [Namao virus]